MKVLMISKALLVSAYHGKLRELSKLGVDLTLVVPARWGKQKLEQVEPDGYDLVVMDCILGGENHLHFYPAISKIVGREPWDLVHIDEEPFSFVTYHTMRACRRAGRTPWLFFTWENINRKYPPPFNWVKRRVLQGAAAGIAGSEEAGEVLRAQGFNKALAVIPQFGVDPDFFCKADVPRLKEKLGVQGKFVIGYVGRVVQEKGIADLIHAAASLPERCVLVLVGSGGFESEARHLAGRLGVASRVRWVSHISSLDIPEYINAFDVLALPSHTTPRWKEQFGRALVEAMACETVVVGSNSGEIPNVIGNAGLVFREGEVTELLDRLQSLYNDRALSLELGAKGRARVLGNFTHREIARKTVELYEELRATRASDALKAEAVSI